MQKTVYLLFVLELFILSVDARVIHFPQMKARSTSVISIDSVELRKDLTRFYFNFKGLPNQWTVVDRSLTLSDPSSGKEWEAIEADGIDLGRKFQFSELGVAKVSVDFPALPDDVKIVDIFEKIQKKPIRLIDIQLESGNKVLSVPQYPIKREKNREQDYRKILRVDTAVLRGYIRGYHPRLKWGEGVIVLDNVVTTEVQNIPVKFNDDGSFEVKMELYYPVQQVLLLPDGYINFYLEPGKELVVYADMDELTRPVLNLEEIESKARYLNYSGELGQENNELKCYRNFDLFDVQQYAEDMRSLSPDSFDMKEKWNLQKKLQNIEKLEKENLLSCKISHLLKMNVWYVYGRHMLDYEQYYTANKGRCLPDSFYTFLGTLPRHDELSLSAADYKLFIHYLEHILPIREKMSWTVNDFLSDFSQYGIELNPEEKELVSCALRMKTPSDTLSIQNFSYKMDKFNRKYKDLQILMRENAVLRKQRQVYINQFGLTPDIQTDLFITRRFMMRLQSLGRPLTSQELCSETENISNVFLKDIVYQKNFSFQK
ncbi:hypothetical protein [Gabonia massiliensis]|uniref:hypothetical protein n=1 Tax=Gabonia massiliensis TaxID=1686296 RepID=UPI0006D8189E|nr:hypothetical protein [Gabonia massiliensis]